MSLLQMILIAALAGLGGIDLFNMKIHFHRPLVSGAIVGWILGDLQTGLIAGAMFELIWLGAVPVGGAQPPNVVVGGIIGTTFAIITKEEPATAIGVAMPVAIAMQAAITFLLTAFSGFMHKADKFAEEGNDRGIANINYLCLFILFMFYLFLLSYRYTWSRGFSGNSRFTSKMDIKRSWNSRRINASSRICYAFKNYV